MSEIEFYLDSYLPNILFSSASIAKKSNPLCALKVKNAVIMKVVMPLIERITEDALTTIIRRHLPIIDLGTDTDGNPIMNTPNFEIVNFTYDFLTYSAYVRFYKLEPRTFDCVEFILERITTDVKLKAMIDMLQNEPQNLIRSESNRIYYHKDTKTGRILACTRKIKIDHTLYKYITMEEPPYNVINSNISKQHLKVIDYRGGIITVALV